MELILGSARILSKNGSFRRVSISADFSLRGFFGADESFVIISQSKDPKIFLVRRFSMDPLRVN